MTIIHQQQPCNISCVATCAAMILNLPVAQVVMEFHDDYRAGRKTLKQYLQSKGIQVGRLYADDDGQIMDDDMVYLATVPSLNTLATNHSVIFDTRNDSFTIYDPNQGREGKKYYIPRTLTPKNEWEVRLGGFTLDNVILHAPAIGMLAEEQAIAI